MILQCKLVAGERPRGATENAGLENDGPSKCRGWKMQDWNLADEIAELENA